MSPLPAALRRAQILEQIVEHGGATIAGLARDHAVSAMTAHRDLEQLARDGLVERVHGGARALAPQRDARHHPTAWEHRVMQASAAKAAIGRHAATLVAPGATVFIDASSTALALARQLMQEPPYELTLVTNSPIIAAEVRADPLHVVVCPGELDQHTRTVSGRWTVEFLRSLRFDVALISAAGVTLDAGLTTARGALAEVCNAARGSAAQAVALVDATKFGRTSLVTIARAQELDLIVTDESLDSEIVAEYRGANVRLQVADSGPAASGE